MSLEAATPQLLSDAALQADRLARRHHLQPADRDDACQDIALDAWHRLTHYRASRGELEPFLGLVTLNRARKIDARLRHQRRAPEVSLDTPIGQPDCTLRHLLAHAGGYPCRPPP